MEIPKHVVESLQKSYQLYAEAHAHMRVVEQWLEKHGIDPDELRDGCGVGLDEVEQASSPSAVKDVIIRIELEY